MVLFDVVQKNEKSTTLLMKFTDYRGAILSTNHT